MRAHTITLEQWREQQTRSNRPYTDPYMNTQGAGRSRELSAIVSTLTPQDDLIDRLIKDRQQRQTVNIVIPISGDKPSGCGTVAGYWRHMKRKSPVCLECRKAFVAARTVKKVAR